MADSVPKFQMGFVKFVINGDPYSVGSISFDRSPNCGLSRLTEIKSFFFFLKQQKKGSYFHGPPNSVLGDLSKEMELT